MNNRTFQKSEIESPDLLDSNWSSSVDFSNYKSPAETVDNLIKELHAESDERKASDKKASEQATKWHRIDLTIAIIGVLIGVLGIIFSVLL